MPSDKGKLKVWCRSTAYHGYMRVAATSQKRAVELLAIVGHPTSLYEFRGYYSEPSLSRWPECEILSRGEEGVFLEEDNEIKKL